MDPLHLLFPVFLARSDSQVNEKAEGTLCDGYMKSACINLHAVLNILIFVKLTRCKILHYAGVSVLQTAQSAKT